MDWVEKWTIYTAEKNWGLSLDSWNLRKNIKTTPNRYLAKYWKPRNKMNIEARLRSKANITIIKWSSGYKIKPKFYKNCNYQENLLSILAVKF